MTAKPTPAQAVVLREVERLSDEYREARILLDETIRRERERQLEDMKTRLRVAVQKARSMGGNGAKEMPKVLILRALKTKDWGTVQKLLDGYQYSEPVQFEWDWDTKMFRVLWFEFSDGVRFDSVWDIGLEERRPDVWFVDFNTAVNPPAPWSGKLLPARDDNPFFAEFWDAANGFLIPKLAEFTDVTQVGVDREHLIRYGVVEGD